jgi:hypothetical protein
VGSSAFGPMMGADYIDDYLAMFRGLDWWVALKDGVFWVPIFVNRDQISWILFVRLIGAFPLLLSVSTDILPPMR